MKNIELNEIKDCAIFSNEYINKDFEEFIKGYEAADLDLDDVNSSCTLRDNNDNYVVVSRYKDTIKAVKYTNDSKESITIDGGEITHTSLIKRKDGVLYSVVKKVFSPSKKHDNRIILSELSEERFALSKDKINVVFGISDYDNATPNLLFNKVKSYYDDERLYSSANHTSSFSTIINSQTTSRGRKKEAFPTTTYLNDTDVSKIYNLDGEDMLYRVFDLYRGSINPRCEKDILNISLGLLSNNAYDMLSASGIKSNEDSIIGKDDELFEYHDYLKDMFERLFAYTGEFGLDRKSLLNVFGYKKYSNNVAKRMISKKLGMPYEEFEQLDFDEQQRIIEKVNGKKMGYDYRLHIDGIPMDEDHIVTIEEVDRLLTDASEDKRFFNKIFVKIINRFKKR